MNQDELMLRTLRQFTDAHIPPAGRTAEFTAIGAAYYEVTPGQRTVLMAMARRQVRALNEHARTTEPRSGRHDMNHADACAALRKRGYSSITAARAVNQASLATAPGEPVLLDRHQVRYTEGGGYVISPRPWPEGETRRPGPEGETRRPGDMLPVHLGEILVKLQLDLRELPALRRPVPQNRRDLRGGAVTITFCVDRTPAGKPGVHVNRWGRRIRSWRAWCGPVAVGWYRFSDYHLVAEPHEWSET